MGKHLFIIGFIFLGFLSCTKPKATLDSVEIELPTFDALNKVIFINEQIGFVVGGKQFANPTMFKTIDGGLTWNVVILPTQNERKEIYSIDALPNGQIVTVGYGGTIFISNDTGRTFTYVQHGSWKELKDVQFQSNSLAYIVGGHGFNEGHVSEFVTNGTGVNEIKETKNFELSDIDVVDSTHMYIAGYGAILKSVDAGLTWNFTTAKNDFFKAMCWKNASEGIAVGYEGSIIKTTDGGASWKVIRTGNDITLKKMHFYDVARNNASTLFVVGEKGVMMISNNDGDSWTETTKLTYDDLKGITFRNDHSCFVVGDVGSLYEIRL